jgi:phosphatidylglycerophosphate synthase
LIAKVAALGRSSGVRPRGWLADAATEVWATGALERSDELGEFLVAPVGMDDDGALTLKFRAFVEAGAPLFICASEDAAALEEAAKIESVRSVTVDALRRYANRARPQTLLVGVQPGECRALLDALFRGMFPRNAGFLVANAITLSRLLVFAPVAIWSVVHDDQVGAFFWYSGGLLTDVLDGFIARYAHGTSEFGKRFDRLVDMAFNVSVIATIGILAVTAGRVAGAIGLLAATFGPVLVTRLMGVKPPGSAIAKLRSGWIRVAVLGYVVLGVDWSAISGRWIAGAVVIGLFLLGAAAYEIRETIREVRLGRRGWFTLGK